MISDEVKKLEEKNEELKRENAYLRMINQSMKEMLSKLENHCRKIIPNQVYTHKERGNTTIKFLDGSQQTVKRRKGEKDCIETAIAYCVLKQLMSAKDLRKLIENREEH